MTINASAVVTLTIEVSVSSGWGEDCKLDQVYRQALVEACQRLHNAIDKGGFHGIKIIGEPSIRAIIAESRS